MKRGIKNQIIISSFNHNSLVRFKELDPEIRTGILTADRIVNVIDYCNSIKADCYHPLFVSCTKEQMIEGNH